ncbi:Zn-dependent alcohol dehydrogenase [Rhodococcus opacus]|uniref:Zinc-containing alcohol dehydrogenase n=1 Tax=Rhodococcus opacus (strain B4) TaxID=632772 RepID=C1ASB0_RHOOB|nr:Zn-dependent alcohol dehydrogenase [Rhodococcus opacus]BAH48359.1 zinc-containing alcohol dehydrogenase [Rhodococcus opacus B4]
MKVKAAVFERVGEPIHVEELDLEDPKRGEVLVRLEAAGVCHSDYHVVKGEWESAGPLVLGHEGAGVVEKIGPGVTSVSVGDHVVLSWVPYCGTCAYCMAGKPALCPKVEETAYQNVQYDGTSRLSRGDESVPSYLATGAFADRVIVHETGAVPIRKDAPLDRAALVGCAVATGVGAVLNTADVQPGDTVLVFGCGGVGLSVIMGAGLVSAGQIIAVDMSDKALELAKSLGATAIINPSRDDVATTVRGLVDERGVDWAFEAIGLKPTIEQAYELISPGGTVVVVGQSADGVTIEIDPMVMSDREKSIIGCNYGSSRPAIDFPRLIDLYMQGKLDLDRLVGHTSSINEVNEAFTRMGQGEGGRTVILYDHA